MLHKITLLEDAKGKSLAFCLINPTYSMAVADHIPPDVAEEAIAEQLNPPAEAAVQQTAEVQPAAEVKPAGLANDARYRTSC